MKKVLLTIFITLFLLSCADFNPLSPQNGVYTIPEILGVEIEIDMGTNECRVFNSNREIVHVLILRRETGSEYIRVFDELIQKTSSFQRECYLSPGDRIKVVVKIGGTYYPNKAWDEDKPIRIKYFEL